MGGAIRLAMRFYIIYLKIYYKKINLIFDISNRKYYIV
jgi:hypothetical protein